MGLAACPLSRLTATAPPRGEPSLASPFGGGGLALARPERATRQRPAQSRVPPPSLIPKGGTRLGRLDRKARRKPPWHRRCHQETPGEGFLRKTVHWTIFLFSCVCRRRLRPWDAVPHPATFEKVDETFTRLRRAREQIICTGVSVAHRPKARLARGATP